MRGAAGSILLSAILGFALSSCTNKGIKLNPITGLQQQACDVQADCPTTLVCQAGFCQKGCKTSLECDGGQVCNGDHFCVAAQVVKTGGGSCTVTAQCEAGNSCQGGVCVVGTSGPGGNTGMIGNPPPVQAAGCGNSQLDAGETCDDGNATGGDYCAADCKSVTGRCGDGTKQINEACDDGDTLDTNSCASDCTRIHVCGDGSVQSNEVCDDGNTLAGDYCAANCQALTGSCGDSSLQTNEACDDGNTSDGDYCPANCLGTPGTSSDGTVQSNEQCDGNYASGTLTMCRLGARETDGYIGNDYGGLDRGVLQCPPGARMLGFDFAWNRVNGGPNPRAYRPMVGFRIACESGSVQLAGGYYSLLPSLCCHAAGETEFPTASPDVSVRCPNGQFVVGGRGWETWYVDTGAVTVASWLSAKCQGPDLGAPLTTATTAGDASVPPATVTSPAIEFACPPPKLLIGFRIRAGEVYDGLQPICQP